MTMCLGFPGHVVELVEGCEGQLALVDVVGARRKVNVGMLDDPVQPGDWVLVHMGFAVERVDADEAQRALEGLELVGRSRDDAADDGFALPPDWHTSPG
jgi:hydrogenase assembly chaperone HypC/HupF